MSNNYDGPVLIDNGVGTAAAPPAGYLGFGRAAGAEVSSGPRILTGTGDANGTLTAPIGSLWLRTDAAAVQQNTDSGTTWATLATV